MERELTKIRKRTMERFPENKNRPTKAEIVKVKTMPRIKIFKLLFKDVSLFNSIAFLILQSSFLFY